MPSVGSCPLTTISSRGGPSSRGRASAAKARSSSAMCWASMACQIRPRWRVTSRSCKRSYSSRRARNSARRSVRGTRTRPREKAIRGRGEQQRTVLSPYASVDLTRIDGISAGAARTILTEVGMDLGSFPNERHCKSWLGLAPRHAGIGWAAVGGQAAARAGSDAHRERPAHGGDGADPVQVGAGGSAAPQGAAQGDEDGGIRHRPQAGGVGVPHAALRLGLR